jgi:hypothetical protein
MNTSIRLYQGQQDDLSIAGVRHVEMATANHYMVEFGFVDSGEWRSFYSRAFATPQEMDAAEPLVIQVKIGAMPSMERPFTRCYRLRRLGPLEEVV